MNAAGIVQLIHDFADMKESATLSREGVKTLSAEIKRLQAIEQAAQIPGVLPDKPWPHSPEIPT